MLSCKNAVMHFMAAFCAGRDSVAGKLPVKFADQGTGMHTCKNVALHQTAAFCAGRDSAAGKLPVKFADLEMHRIIGTGQFGMVRVVRHKKSGEVYALKVRGLSVCPCKIHTSRGHKLAA